MRAPQHHNFWRVLSAVCVICLVSACASSINDSSQTSPVDIAQGIKANQFALQATVMSMADDLNTELSEVVYLIQATPGIDMRTRWYAQGILCDGMGASLDIAAGPNPGVAMLDLLVLSSLQAWVAEKNWVANGFPKESAPKVIQSFQKSRDKLWEKSSQFLNAKQQEILRQLIDAWIAANPNQLIVAFVRVSNFANDRNVLTLENRQLAGGLLKEVNNVTLAIDDARLLGERLLWFMSRYPYIISQQAELTTYRLTDSLTQEIDTQRNSFFDRLAQERRNTFKELDDHSSTLTPFMSDLQKTIEDTRLLSVEITNSMKSFDQMVARFDKEEKPNSQMSIQDVRDLVRETGETTQRLQSLIDTSNSMLNSSGLDSSVNTVNRLSVSLVNRILLGVAGLIVLIFAGIVIVRRMS